MVPLGTVISVHALDLPGHCKVGQRVGLRTDRPSLVSQSNILDPTVSTSFQ